MVSSAGIRAIAQVRDALEDRRERQRVRFRTERGGHEGAAYYGVFALRVGPDDE